MTETETETHLQQAARHVREGHQRILEQEELLARMQANGDPTQIKPGQELLQQFKDLQHEGERHLRRLQKKERAAERREAQAQRRTVHRARFTVIATGSALRASLEKTAKTAVEAEQHLFALLRLSGQSGTVEVLGANGRPISREYLARLALAENEAAR